VTEVVRNITETRSHPASLGARLTPFILYLLLTIAMTWPLASGITRDVPGDLGDSLLNMWILGWGAESIPRVITGQMAVRDIWNANIFHPEPLALSFSEHLFGEVLQILPVYQLTRNLILCYNLLFLSTFVLSGLGMYLLVRDITADRGAAFVAGLFYAFVPVRVAQVAHIQILSSQWMPFALYGFRRFAYTSRVRGLIGGAAALIMQNLSCGYYLVYFAPFVVFFTVHQVVASGRARDRRVWWMFAVAGLLIIGATAPFLWMYLEAQRIHAFQRPTAEIVAFSADVFGYLTAPEALRVLGAWLRAWPRPEGEVFLGFTPTLLALVALVVGIREARANAVEGKTLFKTVVPPSRIPVRSIAACVTGLAALVTLAGLIAFVFTGGFVTNVAGVSLRATNGARLLWQLAILTTILALLSPKFRAASALFLASPAGIASFSLLLALWLSLGPLPRAQGQVLSGLGLYGFFLSQVPGVDGLRVPARYAMVAAVYLAMLAGIGSAWLMRPRLLGWNARATLVALCAVFLVEAAFAPMPINQSWSDAPAAPPPRVEPPEDAPAVYRQLATMPDETVVAEFPFGDPAWELRYVYYSTVHWKRIVNGYSGGFPQGYKLRVARLQRVMQAPDEAWQTLVQAGTTHVVLHEGAMTRNDASALEGWLESHGGIETNRFGEDVMFQLPARRDTNYAR